MVVAEVENCLSDYRVGRRCLSDYGVGRRFVFDYMYTIKSAYMVTDLVTNSVTSALIIR